MRKRPRENEVNYWPGVADCMLGLFMIALILGITNKVIELIPETTGGGIMITREDLARYESLETELDKEKNARQKLEDLILEITKERDDLLKENSKLKATIADLNERIKGLKDENDKLKGENDKPPILVVDATQVSFDQGKANLQRSHIVTLEKDVFSELLRIVNKYISVDTIEIIGHTDRSSIGGKSNLDHNLLKALKGNDASILTAGSNADLGLMRAIAVKHSWDQWLRKEGMNLPRPIMVRCYSAAQGIPPVSKKEDWFASQARRIEIRFTQLEEIKNAENIKPLKEKNSKDIEEMNKEEAK